MSIEQFKVYKNYGYASEKLIDETNDLDRAIETAKSEAANDTGVFEVIQFAPSGEAITHWLEDGITEDDGQPSEMQEWADFDPDC